MTFYETHRKLIGFRLKLKFDRSVLAENGFIYVDVAKTPTVGNLVDDIINRFQISTDIFLELELCKLLRSENVCVLADVEDVRVRCFSTKKSGQQTVLNNVMVNEKESDASSHTTEILQASSILSHYSDNRVDNSHQENDAKSTKMHRSHIREGVAYVLEKLREEHNYSEGNTSKINSESEMQQNSATDKKIRCLDSLPIDTMSCDVNSFRDINESIRTDNQEFIPEIKKRKRKRKHSKKARDEEYSAENGFDGTFTTPTPSSPSCHRKHIYFKDEDKEENGAEENGMDTTDTREPALMPAGMSSKIINDNNSAKRVTDVEKPKDFCDYFNSHSRKMRTSFQSSSADMLWKPANQSSDEQKTAADNSPKTAVGEANAAHLRKAEVSSGQKSPHYTPASPVDFEKLMSESSVPRRLSLPTQKSSPSLFFRQISEKSREMEPKIEEQLSTLLMNKELKTYNHYNVQFPNQNNSSYRKNSLNEFSKKSLTGVEDSSLALSGQFDVTRRKSSSSVADGHVEEDAKFEITGCDIDRKEIRTPECEVLKQFKFSETHILMRKPNDDWEIVTPLVAAREFATVEEPKVNQTIVFQIFYLDDKHIPVMSDLICGQIVHVKGKDIALDIPVQFQKKIFDESDEGMTVQGFTHLTGSTYQVPFSYLRNVRLLS